MKTRRSPGSSRSLAWLLGASALGLLACSTAPNPAEPTHRSATADPSDGIASIPAWGPPRSFEASVSAMARSGPPGPLDWIQRVDRTHSSRIPTAVSPVAVARRVLEDVAIQRGLSPQLAQMLKAKAIQPRVQGPIVVEFRGEVAGTDVFLANPRVLLKADLEPVALVDFPKADWTNVPRRPFVASAQDAILAALQAKTGMAWAAQAIQNLEGVEAASASGGFRSARVQDASGAWRNVRVKNVYFPQGDTLLAAYQVELPSLRQADGTTAMAHAFVVDAETRDVLFEKSLVADAFGYRVWADASGRLTPLHGPQGLSGFPHPTGKPDGFSPTPVSSQLVTLNEASTTMADPWLAPDAEITSGNNVNAYADLKEPDGLGTGDFHPKVTSPGVFDFPYDPDKSPQGDATQTAAVVTQLFYVLNYMHDLFYDAGFNEAAGNAQQSNFGRGGVEGDPMLAEAQDFDGRNNANCATPSDGASPVIQMYLFDGEGAAKVTVQSPSTFPTPLDARPASFDPTTFDLSGDLVLVQDGQGTASDGCEAPFANANAVRGKIALVDRGTCSFLSKVQNATGAGAIGVIVANNVAGPAPTMGANQGAPITIPTLSVSQPDGAALKQALAGGTVRVNLKRDRSLDRDGALDTAIVSHEWGHYLSNRLIGNALGLNNPQGFGMGEGWSDFVSLLTMVREETDPAVPRSERYSGAFGVGTWVMSAGRDSGAYFGVRRYPYSVRKDINPLTLTHIQDGERLPSTATASFGEDGRFNSESHNTGEVWASMLWECYVALLRDPRWTFDQANERMRRYLVTSLRMTPKSPTILEARDALLAAAFASDEGDFVLFAEAFARRGAGTGAKGPERTSKNQRGVTQSFVAGNTVAMVGGFAEEDPARSCDGDGILDSGEVARLTIQVRNTGTRTLTATKARLSSDTPGLTFPLGTEVAVPVLKPYETTTITTDVALANQRELTLVAVQVALVDPTISPELSDQTGRGEVTFQANFDFVGESSKVDNVEAKDTLWKPSGNRQLSSSENWKRVRKGLNQSWVINANDAVSDQYLVSPDLQVSETEPFRMTFRHRHSFEQQTEGDFDGGVLEISADDGKTWKDMGQAAGVYNGTLSTEKSDNPLKGRAAFVGNSPAYPEYSPVLVDLGTAYAGKTVKVRFRTGTDEGTAFVGWDVDDIGFEGITNRPFTAQVKNVCGAPQDVPAPAPAPEPPVDSIAGVAAAGAGCTMSPAHPEPFQGSFAASFAASFMALFGSVLGARRARRKHRA